MNLLMGREQTMAPAPRCPSSCASCISDEGGKVWRKSQFDAKKVWRGKNYQQESIVVHVLVPPRALRAPVSEQCDDVQVVAELETRNTPQKVASICEPCLLSIMTLPTGHSARSSTIFCTAGN